MWQLQEPPKRAPKKKPPAAKRVREKRATKAQESTARYWSLVVPPADPDETCFRHSHWSVRREKVRQAMVASMTSDFAVNRFVECGSEAVIEYSEQAGKHRVKANYCKCRHCEPCMRAKANLLSANLKKRLKDKPNGRYRFVTLPLKHSDTPLRAQVDRLYKAFKALRNSKFWKRSQRGGVFFLEVKWNDESRLWHPHLHIICEGEFLNQAELSTQWHKATGDSYIVDVRALKSGEDAAHYVSKYVTKGTSANVWDDRDAAQEWVHASKGVRVCATFGNWRGFKLTKVDKSINDWKPVCTLRNLIQRFSEGEVHAQNLFLLLRPPGASDCHVVPGGKG